MLKMHCKPTETSLNVRGVELLVCMCPLLPDLGTFNAGCVSKTEASCHQELLVLQIWEALRSQCDAQSEVCTSNG